MLKTNVRVVAATNVNLMHAVSKGKFREDLFYRLNAVTIMMPSLRQRPGDINLLFRKFSSDFADRYGMPKAVLTEEASILLRKYRWPGNIRQLKNVAETVSAIEAAHQAGRPDRFDVDAETLRQYLPNMEENLLPATVASARESADSVAEREAIIRAIFQLRQDVDNIKAMLLKGNSAALTATTAIEAPDSERNNGATDNERSVGWKHNHRAEDAEENEPEEQDISDIPSEDNSIKQNELELMMKVLKKHNGNRKAAAEELQISERTLYRKIKQYNL